MGCCSARDRELLHSLEVLKGRESVYIVPGMCSNAIEVKHPDRANHEVVYLNEERLVTEGVDLFHELELRIVDAKLKNGESVKSVAEKTDGYLSRPVDGLKGCAHLDPEMEFPLAALWMPIIKLLSDDCNLHGLSYDWRKWGDQKYAEEVLEKFRAEVEKFVEEGGTPVSIVCHSMGAQVTLWCLGQLGDKWEQKHVKQLIFCAPAPSGTPVMFPCYANGPVGNMVSGGMVTMPVAVADQDLARITASFPCMMAEMPTDTGSFGVWPKDHVFATTPTKQYNVNNVGSFINDCAACGKEAAHWQVAKSLWPGFQKMASSMRAPVVPAHIIYSKSEDTLSQCNYQSEDLSEAPQLSKYEGGDTTIMGASTEALAEAWKKAGAKEVMMYPTPTEEHVTHGGCINCDFTFRTLTSLLIRRPLTQVDHAD